MIKLFVGLEELPALPAALPDRGDRHLVDGQADRRLEGHPTKATLDYAGQVAGVRLKQKHQQWVFIDSGCSSTAAHWTHDLAVKGSNLIE